MTRLSRRQSNVLAMEAIYTKAFALSIEIGSGSITEAPHANVGAFVLR